MGNLKKICIFGGTFNPVHIGHLIIANHLINQLDIDEIIFLPTQVSPFKLDKNDIISPEHRYNLINLAIKNNKNFYVSDYEISIGGISYSYETVDHFSKIFPKEKLFWLIGGDQIINFHKWKNYQQILENINLVVAKRPGTFKDDEIEKIEKQLNPTKDIFWLDSPNLEISSTHIRDLVRSNKSIKYLVTPECEDYIIKHNLFTD